MEKLTDIEKNILEENLDSFLKNCDIQIKMPVDIFEVATNMGFDIRGVEYKSDTIGSIVVAEGVDKISGFNSNKVIGYDCKMDIHSKKNVVARQLAKYLIIKMNHKEQLLTFGSKDSIDVVDKEFDERYLEYYVRALLIPKKELKKHILVSDINSELISEIQKRFNVSEKIAKTRILEIQGKITDEQVIERT